MEKVCKLRIIDNVKFVIWILLTIVMIGALILLYSLQNWVTPILFLFPLITLTYCIFLGVFRWIRIRLLQFFSWLQFYPFGDESPLLFGFFLSGFLQIFVLLFIGLDVRIHPHLMDNYGNLYLLVLTFCFAIPFLWITSKMILNSRFQFQTQSTSVLVQTMYKTPVYLKLYATSLLIPLGLTILDSLIQFYSNGSYKIWLWQIPLSENNTYTLDGSGFIILLFGIYILVFSILVIWIYSVCRKELNHTLAEDSSEFRQSENIIQKKVLRSLIGE